MWEGTSHMIYLTKSNCNNTIIYEIRHMSFLIFYIHLILHILWIIFHITFTPQRNSMGRELFVLFYRWGNGLREVKGFAEDQTAILCQGQGVMLAQASEPKSKLLQISSSTYSSSPLVISHILLKGGIKERVIGHMF